MRSPESDFSGVSDVMECDAVVSASRHLDKPAGAGVRREIVAISSLTIAGWTGRDREAQKRHIEELAKLGIKRSAKCPRRRSCGRRGDVLRNADGDWRHSSGGTFRNGIA